MSVIYQHQHKGKEFLNIVDIKWNPPHTTPMGIHNTYRAKVLENLKPAGTILHWKKDETLTKAESISPTFEDFILLTVLSMIDIRLPEKVKEYGHRL